MAKEKIIVAKVETTVGDLFVEKCKSDGKTVNRRLNELVEGDLAKTKKVFVSGKSKIRYKKDSNNFDWSAELDDEKEVLLLRNLSMDFLQDLKKSIDMAIRDRNDWVHKNKEDSVDIPTDLTGGDDENES